MPGFRTGAAVGKKTGSASAWIVADSSVPLYPAQPVLGDEARDARELGLIVRYHDGFQRQTLGSDPEIVCPNRGPPALELRPDQAILSADFAVQGNQFDLFDQPSEPRRILFAMRALFDPELQFTQNHGREHDVAQRRSLEPAAYPIDPLHGSDEHVGIQQVAHPTEALLARAARLPARPGRSLPGPARADERPRPPR